MPNSKLSNNKTLLNQVTEVLEKSDSDNSRSDSPKVIDAGRVPSLIKPNPNLLRKPTLGKPAYDSDFPPSDFYSSADENFKFNKINKPEEMLSSESN